MRKSLFAILIIAVCVAMISAVSSCDGKGNAPDTVPADSIEVDSVDEDIDEYDTGEAILPQAADELFDDFLFNFANNKRLQLRRVRFPLKVTRNSRETTIDSQHWKTERFFMRQDFYTIIFDDAEQMESVNDTSIVNAIVEKISLDNNTITQYFFDREKGKWMLTSINYTTFNSSPNASFLKFYNKFVRDTTFQLASINDPLKFSGPDPDDDFSTMEGLLLPEQWPSFAPELPNGMIYNIVYGKQKPDSNTKILVIRGIANGLETELMFARRKDSWVLTELTM